MNRLALSLLMLGAVLQAFGDTITSGTTPLNKGKLQSNLDGNGKLITNLVGVVGTSNSVGLFFRSDGAQAAVTATATNVLAVDILEPENGPFILKTNGFAYKVLNSETNIVKSNLTLGRTNRWLNPQGNLTSVGFIGGPPDGGGWISFVRPGGTNWNYLQWYREDEHETNYFGIGPDVAYNGAFFALAYDNAMGVDVNRYGLHGGQHAKFAFGSDGINTNAFISIHDLISNKPGGVQPTNTIEMLSLEHGIRINSRTNVADLIVIQRDSEGQQHAIAHQQGNVTWRNMIGTNPAAPYDFVLAELHDNRSGQSGGPNLGGAFKMVNVQRDDPYNMELFGGLVIGKGTNAANRGGSRLWLGDYGTNKISISHGTGAPEGVISAHVGSLYLRDDGVAGSTLYNKWTETATATGGNTGWGLLAIGAGVSTTAAGVTNEIWIGQRTDGIAGDGTLSNPRNGSTTALYDDIFTNIVPNVSYRLLPGTFTTKGMKAATRGLTRGNRIIGSGRDVTTLKLDPAWAITNIFAGDKAVEMIATQVEGEEQGYAQADIHISDLTIDCNYANLTLAVKTNYTFAHINLHGANAIIERVNFKSGHNASGTSSVECFSVYLFSTNCTVRDCLVSGYDRNPHSTAIGSTFFTFGNNGTLENTTIDVSDVIGGSSTFNGVGFYRNGTTIRNNRFIGSTNAVMFAIYSDTASSGSPTDWTIDGNEFINVSMGIAPRVANLNVSGCKIVNNKFKILGGILTGAAIWAENDSGAGTSPTWSNNVFSANTITADGTGQGAIMIYGTGYGQVTNFFMSDNVIKPGMVVRIPAAANVIGANNLYTTGEFATNETTSLPFGLTKVADLAIGQPGTAGQVWGLADSTTGRGAWVNNASGSFTGNANQLSTVSGTTSIKDGSFQTNTVTYFGTGVKSQTFGTGNLWLDQSTSAGLFAVAPADVIVYTNFSIRQTGTVGYVWTLANSSTGLGGWVAPTSQMTNMISMEHFTMKGFVGQANYSNLWTWIPSSTNLILSLTNKSGASETIYEQVAVFSPSNISFPISGFHIDANQSTYYTNQTQVTVDFSKGYNIMGTNDNFTLLGPINVDGSKTTVQKTTIIITNAPTGGTQPFTITSPAGTRSIGTQWCTNVTKIEVEVIPFIVTNLTYTPWW